MPRPTLRALASALAVATGLLGAAPAHADVAGVNLGAPVWHAVPADAALDATIATGGHFVRVNFRLDDWSSPADPTLHGGKSWFDVYDRVVDAITSQGLEVYGLLNDEITTGFSRPYDSPAFEDAYAANALAVIDRYKDRVRVWETINEPNDWAGGTSARMPADVFARVHARLYDEVKGKHPGEACWDVALVTGPLFSFDDNPSSDYLDAAIAAGRAGGRWAALRAALGRDPIDGAGYHLYVAQGSGSPTSDVGAKGGANLDALAAVLGKYGIAAKIWVSEIGFRVPDVTEDEQAARLDATYDTLGARGDVASLQWFSIQDFPGNDWGLYRATGFGAADQRPAYARFTAQARAHAPALAAKLTVALPATVAPGATVTATVTATNLGKDAWTATGGVRLGAAAGCPDAWAINGWTWDDPGAARGYVKGPTDARVFLADGASIAQGASATFAVALTAPATAGKLRFAARMVKEGSAWFGATAWADVDVTAGGGDAGDASVVDAPPGDGGKDGAAVDAPKDAARDGGADAGHDATGAGDASAIDDASLVPAVDSSSGGGCGCRLVVGGAPSPSTSLGLVALVAVATAVHRRRRR